MRCERCFGRGRVVVQVQHYRAGQMMAEMPEIMPCPVCHGACVIHCCDGEQAQPREQAMLNAVGEVNPNEVA